MKHLQALRCRARSRSRTIGRVVRASMEELLDAILNLSDYAHGLVGLLDGVGDGGGGLCEVVKDVGAIFD